MRHLRFLLAPLALALLSGCPNAASVGFPYAGTPGPSASPTSLSNLIANSGAATPDLTANLSTPVSLSFPVRLGIVFYNYQPAMQPEDFQQALDTFRKGLPASLVRESVVVPSSLVAGVSSLEDIRNLVAQFSLDTLLIVTGSDAIGRAAQQPSDFFAQFSSDANFQASCELDALVLNVLSDRFLPPLTAAGASGPSLLDPNNPGFHASTYQLQQQAETQALSALQTRLIQTVQAVPSAPPATPAPFVTPTPKPATSDGVSPSPLPS